MDYYSVDGTIVLDYYKVLVSWVEGTAFNVTQAGSCDWNHREHAGLSWTSGGCQGSGTDHAATKDGSVTLTVVDSDFPIPITAALTQAWIDDSANNFGILLTKPAIDALSALARSSEAVEGNKPYFLMEWLAMEKGSSVNGLLGGPGKLGKMGLV